MTVGCGEDKAPSGEADPAQGASAEESAGEGEGGLQEHSAVADIYLKGEGTRSTPGWISTR